MSSRVGAEEFQCLGGRRRRDADGDQLRLDHAASSPASSIASASERARCSRSRRWQRAASSTVRVALHRLGQAGEVAAGEIGEQPAHGLAVGALVGDAEHDAPPERLGEGADGPLE